MGKSSVNGPFSMAMLDNQRVSFALPMTFLEGGTDMAGFEKLLVVRGLRLLRLARVLRMVGRFKVGSKPAMGGLMRIPEQS